MELRRPLGSGRYGEKINTELCGDRILPKTKPLQLKRLRIPPRELLAEYQKQSVSNPSAEFRPLIFK
jgi:hypothetical protein